MAEKKQRTVVSAKEEPKKSTSGKAKTVEQAKPVGNAGALRATAVVMWVLAIVCEALGFLMYFGKINITFVGTLTAVIAVLVLDLIFVVIGSICWKKANHIKPASEKNKLKFFLWNNMGVIVSIIAFLPYLILILTDKDKKFDKKTKTIAAVAAVIALVIAGLTSVDYNPVSEEQLQAATQTIEGDVYWTPYGKVYHTTEECSHLNNSDKLIYGTVEEAIAANKSRLCYTCAKRDNIEGVATNE